MARALETGAADYIVKPFSPTELTARVRGALRRQEPESFVLGELAIDYEHRRVTVGGHPVRLTATEYELLRLLSVNAGRVVTYDSLFRQVWGGKGSAKPALVRTFVMYPPPQARRRWRQADLHPDGAWASATAWPPETPELPEAMGA